MSIISQANAMANKLLPWCQQESAGTAVVVSDLLHMWQQAFQSNGKLRVLICLFGEEARGDFPTAAATHRVDRHWVVAVTRGRGFVANRGDTLTDTTGNNKPLYQLTEQVRDIIRSMLDASVESPVDYRGFKPMTAPTGELIDGYLLEVVLVDDLPAIVSTPPNQIVIPT